MAPRRGEGREDAVPCIKGFDTYYLILKLLALEEYHNGAI